VTQRAGPRRSPSQLLFRGYSLADAPFHQKVIVAYRPPAPQGKKNSFCAPAGPPHRAFGARETKFRIKKGLSSDKNAMQNRIIGLGQLRPRRSPRNLLRARALIGDLESHRRQGPTPVDAGATLERAPEPRLLTEGDVDFYGLRRAWGIGI